MRDLEIQLKEPFEPSKLEWRVQQAGKQNDNQTGEVKHWALVLAYVTNRAIMDRLDEVFGIEGWSNEFTVSPGGGILCGITAYFKEVPITKYDGAENTAIEPVKGGLSNAMKRSAVMWGIGRYLYDLEATFVSMGELKPPNMKGYGIHYDKDSKKRYYWKHPELPEWALPKVTKPSVKG